MNTDFVPLSSLLESMKSPSFEGISPASTHTASKEKQTSPSQSASPQPSVDQKTAPAPEPPKPPEPEKVCKEPKILLDHEGDKISRIRVLCSCGQSIVLDCNYPN